MKRPGAMLPGAQRRTLESVVVEHFFYAAMRTDAGSITVEATEPWGRSYATERRLLRAP